VSSPDRQAAVPAGVLTGPEARAHWERIAAAAPLSVGRLPLWADMVCASGRFTDATRAYRRPDGRVLVLPLVRRRTPPGRLALYESWPWGWDAGVDSGGLVSEGEITPEDVEVVAADLARLPAARVRVQPAVADGAAWAAADLPGWLRRSATSHVVDLPAGGGPPVLDGLSRNSLRKLRKGERSFSVESDDSGRLLPVFQTLLQRSMDAWAEQHWLPTPLARRLLLHRDPPERRADLVRRLDGGLRVWVASDDSRPVAAIVVLSAGPTAVYWGGATDKEAARNRGAGQLVHACALEAAVAEGRARYDMGASGAADLVGFKEGMGARAVEHPSFAVEHVPITSTEARLRGGLRVASARAAQARQVLGRVT
jgi:hypothetical protein